MIHLIPLQMENHGRPLSVMHTRPVSQNAFRL
jgi:hypothetical protein